MAGNATNSTKASSITANTARLVTPRIVHGEALLRTVIDISSRSTDLRTYAAQASARSARPMIASPGWTAPVRYRRSTRNVMECVTSRAGTQQRRDPEGAADEIDCEKKRRSHTIPPYGARTP